MQTIINLDNGAALKLTTARYYTPSGRSIHKERPRHPDMGDMTAAMMDGAEAPSLDQDPADGEAALPAARLLLALPAVLDRSQC